MLFAKPEYKEIELPFVFVDDPSDSEAGGISIEAYGHIFGQKKYCLASYELKNPKMYDNGDYAQMIDLLKNSADKTVKITIKIKKGIPKDFKIDVNSLAQAYNDERFNSLSLLSWGFNDKSFKELNLK